MSNVAGFKVDDTAKLATNQVDTQGLVVNITRAFAQQIFCDGFYSADPHPGNILVDSATNHAVLLDFGLVKELDGETRYNFAKLLVAAAEQDIQGLLDALEGVGLRLRPDVPFDLALLVKYFFRDAVPKEQAQEESKQRRETYKKKTEQKRRLLFPGDPVNVKVCVCVCVCLCVCLCVCVRALAYTYTYVFTYVDTYLHTYIHIFT